MAGVFSLKVGDAVYGIAPGCMGRSVFVPAELMVHKPSTVSFEDAATAPTAYCTVNMAFNSCVDFGPDTKVTTYTATRSLTNVCMNQLQ